MLHSESTIKQHFIILAMCMVFPEHHTIGPVKKLAVLKNVHNLRDIIYIYNSKMYI